MCIYNVCSERPVPSMHLCVCLAMCVDYVMWPQTVVACSEVCERDVAHTHIASSSTILNRSHPHTHSLTHSLIIRCTLGNWSTTHTHTQFRTYIRPHTHTQWQTYIPTYTHTLPNIHTHISTHNVNHNYHTHIHNVNHI